MWPHFGVRNYTRGLSLYNKANSPSKLLSWSTFVSDCISGFLFLPKQYIHLSLFYFTAPSIPRDIKATLIGKSSIKVTWNAPVDLNGIIREYEIEYGYNEKDKMVHVANKKSIDAVVFPERQLILKDLMMNTLYNVSVRERTEVGLWSEMTVVPIKTKEGGTLLPDFDVLIFFTYWILCRIYVRSKL